MIGIYKITCNETGKCYIGQSIDIANRWTQHICAAKYESDNNKFYNALRKYGYENFTYEVIEECSNDQEVLDDRERYWIEYYHSYENGYNSTRGGQNKAWIYDPDVIRKMWDDGFTTGEIRKVLGCGHSTVNNRLRGYNDFNTYTSHQRSCGTGKCSHRIIQFSEKQLEYFGNTVEVYQYSLMGDYIASYETQEQAARAVGGKYPDNIGQCFRGEHLHRTAYGYQWSKEKVDRMPMTSTSKGTIVHCITTDMYFPSTTEATKWCGLKSTSNIKDCCRGVVKTAGKHPETKESLRWEYIR